MFLKNKNKTKNKNNCFALEREEASGMLCHLGFSTTWVMFSQWRRWVRVDDAFAPSPSPRMLPRRATLNVLTHFSTPWICMKTKPQWSLSNHILYSLCRIHVFQCVSISVNTFLLLTVSASVFCATGGCVLVSVTQNSSLQLQYPTYSTWYYVSSVSEPLTSGVQTGCSFIASHFVYSWSCTILPFHNRND